MGERVLMLLDRFGVPGSLASNASMDFVRDFGGSFGDFSPSGAFSRRIEEARTLSSSEPWKSAKVINA